MIARTAGTAAVLVLSFALSSIALPSIAKKSAYPSPPLDEPMEIPDASLTLAEYTELGVPSTRREWTPMDYATTLEIFAREAANTPGLLPRGESPKSSLLFSRLVADENFSSVTDEFLDAAARGQFIAQFMEVIDSLALAYIGAMRSDPSLSKELVEIYAFRMRFMIAANRWASTASRAEAQFVTKATVDAVMIAATLVANPTALPLGARLSLARHLDKNLPTLLSSLPEEIQGRVSGFVAEAARRESNPRISAALSGLAKRLPASDSRKTDYPPEAFAGGSSRETASPSRTRGDGAPPSNAPPPWLEQD